MNKKFQTNTYTNKKLNKTNIVNTLMDIHNKQYTKHHQNFNPELHMIINNYANKVISGNTLTNKQLDLLQKIIPMFQ